MYIHPYYLTALVATIVLVTGSLIRLQFAARRLLDCSSEMQTHFMCVIASIGKLAATDQKAMLTAIAERDAHISALENLLAPNFSDLPTRPAPYVQTTLWPGETMVVPVTAFKE